MSQKMSASLFHASSKKVVPAFHKQMHDHGHHNQSTEAGVQLWPGLNVESLNTPIVLHWLPGWRWPTTSSRCQILTPTHGDGNTVTWSVRSVMDTDPSTITV